VFRIVARRDVMITVLCVIGTRPEAIKMAPVVQELARHPQRVRTQVCATGQHRELLEGVLDLFGIVPDFDLKLMQPDQGLAALTAALCTGLDRVLGEVQPDWVLAQGDTTTALVAALLAYYHRRSFGHVEAGLRTGDKYRPFPEEINRRLAGVIADAHFAPTARARQALLREGIPDGQIHVTGNTVVDAVQAIASRPYDWDSGPLGELPRDGRLVLITAHRRESFGGPFQEICQAIVELARAFAAEGVHFVYPVHLNPNVRRPVSELLAGVPNIHLLAPLDYPALIHLMQRSELILTDSGGIQEEAPGLGVPVLVLRDTTERPEGIEAGVGWLVGTRRERIVAETKRLLGHPAARAAMTTGTNPYGDGRAAARIAAILLAKG
jgi:UDP-N-acetylglucosamine 2-epimerase